MNKKGITGFSVSPIENVRIGFIGLGYRGILALQRYACLSGVSVVAVCDEDVERVEAAEKMIDCSSKVRGYVGEDGWKILCEDQDIDLVYICTDWRSHAEIACYAMECGKHVAVEVPAATSVEECWHLVRTSKRTHRHCMMLENCIYDVFEMATFNMVQDGVFGDIYQAEGGYIHNIPQLNEWRVAFNNDRKGDNYPTHGFGPLCRLMGIHRTDKLHTITSFYTPYSGGSHVISVIRTEKGKSMILQHNIHAARPYSRIYQFTGEKGCVMKYPVEKIAILPNSESWMTDDDTSVLVEKYLPHYYSDVKKIMPSGLEQKRFMDYVMDYRLIHCLRNGLPLDMDVYDAAEWSCISELSHISIENGSVPVVFPDFSED